MKSAKPPSSLKHIKNMEGVQLPKRIKGGRLRRKPT
jgi:hypothetical protein